MELPVLPSATQIGPDSFAQLSGASLAVAAGFVALTAALMLGPVLHRTRLLWLLAFGVGLRLVVAVRDPVALMQWPTSDDSYYYFTIAQNWVAGEGLRHDSFHPTTGFQPLFLLLVAPLFALAPTGDLAIRGVLLLQTALGAGLGLCLYALARRLAEGAGHDGGLAGLVVLASWCVSPIFVTAELNGLETGLSLLAVCATLLFYAGRFAAERDPGPREYATLGAALGLCFLARVDNGLLALALGADVLWRRARRTPPLGLATRLAVLGLTAAAVASPWLLYNALATGSVVPTSGQAVRVLSQAFGFRFVDGSRAWPESYFAIGHAPLAWYAGTVWRALELLPRLCAQVLPLWVGAPAVLAACVLCPRLLARPLRGLLGFAAFGVLLFAAYTGFVFGHWFFGRYLLPFAVGYALLVALSVDALARSERLRRAVESLRAGAAVAGIASLAIPLLGTLSKIEEIGARQVSRHYRAALWANENTPQDAVIGAFQAGILGFHLERRFHALDGKVNAAAVRALADGTLDRYAVERELDYVMDQPWILRDLFAQRSLDPGFLSAHERVWDGAYHVYRLGTAP